MPIFVDPRIGSTELQPYFRPYDVQIEVLQLDAADFAFCGNGPEGPCMVGVERKVLTDAIASMRSERFAGEQLAKLVDRYQHIVVLVEGIWRAGPDTGAVEVRGNGREWIPVRLGNRTVLYRELDHWLASLEYVVDDMLRGERKTFKLVRTSDPAQTAAWLVSRYKWWNNKEWGEHGSFRGIYSPELPPPTGTRRGFSIPRAGPVEDVAARFPGVKGKAWNFGKVFKSVHAMVNADEKGLAAVDGVGKKMAGNIWRWLRGTGNHAR